MSKHTPGPYKADTVSAHTGDIGISALDGRIVVASVHNGASVVSLLRDGTAETQWANASLIAAAPEMLEALKVARGVMTNNWHNMPRIGMEYACAVVDAAIAKAEGRS